MDEQTNGRTNERSTFSILELLIAAKNRSISKYNYPFIRVIDSLSQQIKSVSSYALSSNWINKIFMIRFEEAEIFNK